MCMSNERLSRILIFLLILFLCYIILESLWTPKLTQQVTQKLE